MMAQRLFVVLALGAQAVFAAPPFYDAPVPNSCAVDENDYSELQAILSAFSQQCPEMLCNFVSGKHDGDVKLSAGCVILSDTFIPGSFFMGDSNGTTCVFLRDNVEIRGDIHLGRGTFVVLGGGSTNIFFTTLYGDKGNKYIDLRFLTDSGDPTSTGGQFEDIRLDGGDDIVLVGGAVAEFRIYTHGGDDFIGVEETSVHPSGTVKFRITLDGGSGDDVIVALGSQQIDKITGGKGDDFIAVEDSIVNRVSDDADTQLRVVSSTISRVELDKHDSFTCLLDPMSTGLTIRKLETEVVDSCAVELRDVTRDVDAEVCKVPTVTSTYKDCDRMEECS